MLIEVSNLTEASAINLSDLHLLDANIIFPTMFDNSRTRVPGKQDSNCWRYKQMIVGGIEDGALKNCAVARTNLLEIYGLAGQSPRAARNLVGWMEKIKNSECSILYEFDSENGQVDGLTRRFQNYRCDKADKIFLATLILSGITVGVSDDHDAFALQPMATKLHHQMYVDRRLGKGYRPLSIIDSKYFCQINKLI